MVRKERGAIGEHVISGARIGAGVGNILISTADDNFRFIFENFRGLRGEDIEYLAGKCQSATTVFSTRHGLAATGYIAVILRFNVVAIIITRVAALCWSIVLLRHTLFPSRGRPFIL